jgi:hypothetical protein
VIFGKLPIKPEVLATILVSELTKEVQRQGKEADWTNILKTILREMGKKRNHPVSPDPDDDERQFLLDLIWWKNPTLMDITLAVESEWGTSREVLHDFGKLLVVKAPLKLMVFEKDSSDTVEKIEQNYMRKYTQHVLGEHYLLLEFDTQKKEANPFHFTVPSNGRLRSVKFRRLAPILWRH